MSSISIILTISYCSAIIYTAPQYLLDADLDPFLVDLKGNNIFINLVKCSRLWALHYVYTTLW